MPASSCVTTSLDRLPTPWIFDQIKSMRLFEDHVVIKMCSESAHSGQLALVDKATRSISESSPESELFISSWPQNP
jgi:hypothetical protein